MTAIVRDAFEAELNTENTYAYSGDSAAIYRFQLPQHRIQGQLWERLVEHPIAQFSPGLTAALRRGLGLPVPSVNGALIPSDDTLPTGWPAPVAHAHDWERVAEFEGMRAAIDQCRVCGETHTTWTNVGAVEL